MQFFTSQLGRYCKGNKAKWRQGFGETGPLEMLEGKSGANSIIRQFDKIYHKPSICPLLGPTNSIQENVFKDWPPGILNKIILVLHKKYK